MKSRYLTILIIFSFFLVFKSNTQNVVRGPYLQMVTPHSIIIRWRTESPADSKVWYGNSPDDLSSTKYQSGSRTEHEIKIAGLSPNTTYFYAVGDSITQLAGADKNHYFTTSPPHGVSQPVSIWVLGDAGKKTNRQRAVRNAFYRFNGGPHTDLILLLGDNAYDDGTDAEFQEALFENMYEESLVNSVMWPTAGNHDVHSADSQAGTGPYYDIFNCPQNGEAGGVPSSTEAYYSFDYANIHFISLNTEDIDHSEASPMLAWLKKDIDSTSQDWIVAFFHKPPYYDFVEDFRKNFLPVLEAGGVDLVLYGHRHHYSRSFLMNGHYGGEETFDTTSMVVNQGDGRHDGEGAYEKPLAITPNAGTIYLNTGSAGVASHEITNFPFLPWEIGPPVMGSTHISVSGRQMEVKFIAHGGNVRDHFTIYKVSGSRPRINLISPVDGTAYPAMDTMIITTEASDPDGQVALVEFFANGASVGTDSSAPFSMDWNVPSEDIYEIYAVATDNNGNTAQTQNVTIEVGITTRCAGIANSSDDAEQTVSDGDMSLTSSDLELCDEEETQIVGLRFQELHIPPKAQIVHAHIQFTVDEASNLDPCRLDIYGEASAAPGTFTDTLYDLADRPRTKAFVSWTPNFWVEIDDAEPSQKTPDIQPVIQEIVNLDGYTSNNTISIIIEGAGQRVAKSFDKDPAKAAKLCITYKTSDTGFDCPALGANIGDPCDDNDPGTVNDVIQADCSCSGDPPDSDGDGTPDPADECNGGPEPGTSCDDSNPNTFHDVIASDCICQGVPIPNSGVLEIQVDSSNDDAEEKVVNGQINLTSSDLELTYSSSGAQIVGIRFNDIPIQQGAPVDKAYIQFTTDEISTGVSEVIIWGEAADHASAFTGTDYDVSSRIRTTALVNWTIPEWLTVDEAGAAQRTPDLNTVIQEITRRPGWSVGNSLAFFFEGNGTKSAVSYDGSTGDAPKLIIEYPPETSDSLAIKAFHNSTAPLEYGDRTTEKVHSKLEVFPNPVDQQLNIRTRLHPALKDKSASVTIYYFDGKTIIQQEQIPLNGKWIEHQLDVSQLHPGLYFLSLDTSREVLTNRFIKI